MQKHRLSTAALWETLPRRKIRLIENNARCCHLKKLTGKGTLRQVFICLGPTPLLVASKHTVDWLADSYHKAGWLIPYSGLTHPSIPFFWFFSFSYSSSWMQYKCMKIPYILPADWVILIYRQVPFCYVFSLGVYCCQLPSPASFFLYPNVLSHLLKDTLLCRWFRFAQLAKGKKFRP